MVNLHRGLREALLQLPDGWDVRNIMEAAIGGKLMIRAEIHDPVSLRLFHKFFDDTVRMKWTHDRHKCIAAPDTCSGAVPHMQSQSALNIVVPRFFRFDGFNHAYDLFSSPVLPDISIRAHALSSPNPLFPHFVVFSSGILSLC